MLKNFIKVHSLDMEYTIDIDNIASYDNVWMFGSAIELKNGGLMLADETTEEIDKLIEDAQK